MSSIMGGQVSEEDLTDLLLALREKGPSIEEITSAAKVMRKFAIRIPTRHDLILDTCGTGGDKKNTFNISTIVAFVVSGAGVVVAKHGNRAVSSSCGSADLLEALGVNLNIEQEHLSECLDELGIAFLFAQKFHPAMKNVAHVRKQLGVETIFNVLGPLTNPAIATHQMLGVYDRSLLETMANVLKNLGLEKALVVQGSDGLDEVTLSGKTSICELSDDKIRSYEIHPKDFGIAGASLETVKGGSLDKNLKIAKDILTGKIGPHRDIVILNAGCALYAAQAAKTIADGIQLANKSIDSGKALEKLDALKEFTNSGN